MKEEVPRILVWAKNEDSSYSIVYGTPEPSDKIILQFMSDFPIQYAEDMKEQMPEYGLYSFYKKFDTEDEMAIALSAKDDNLEMKTLCIEPRGNVIYELYKRLSIYEEYLRMEKDMSLATKLSNILGQDLSLNRLERNKYVNN
ncbi:MAG: hypothetical protein AABW88_04550 [Nanoarchaeota archaeon]